MKTYIILTLNLMTVPGLMASSLQNSEDDIYGPPRARAVESTDYSPDELVNIANLQFSDVEKQISVDEIVGIANLSLSEVGSVQRSSLGASSRSTLPLNPLEQIMMRVYGVRTLGAKETIEEIAVAKGTTVAQFLCLVPQRKQ